MAIPWLPVLAGVGFLADKIFGSDEPQISQVQSPQQAALYNQISPLIGNLSSAAQAARPAQPGIYSPMRSRFTGYGPPQGGYQPRQRPAQPWWAQRTPPGGRPNMGRGPAGIPGSPGGGMGGMNPQMIMSLLNMVKRNPQLKQQLGL